MRFREGDGERDLRTVLVRVYIRDPGSLRPAEESSRCSQPALYKRESGSLSTTL